MSAKDRAQKDRQHAAYMKDHKIERITGQCPWGCGASIPNGGPALINHLQKCRGNPRKDGRNRGGRIRIYGGSA